MEKIKITSQDTIYEMEAAHIAALCNLKGAVPRSAKYPSEVVFPEYALFNPLAVELPKESKVDFCHRTFDCAAFNCQCFDGYNFSRGSFQIANFHGASLRNTNFSHASLLAADFSNADLRGAKLCGANLIHASLKSADLRGADLTGAGMFGAIFENAKIDETTIGFLVPMACPSERGFIGWKKALVDVAGIPEAALVKLEIPEDAKRSSATTYKCRTNKAKVLDIVVITSEVHYGTAYSYYDNSFVYRVGETVEVADFDDNRFNECAAGIHFFVSKEAALAYEMV